MDGILAGTTGRRQRDATKRRSGGAKRRKMAKRGGDADDTVFNFRQYFYYCLAGNG
ncbi:MAG: hypothetical protein WBG17_08740 [Burkholderiaceae bacterium]